MILPILLIALWTTIALNWSYSKGDRAGYIQKFSQKGWICKTWEGEIAMVNMPGQAQEKFAFSARDDSIAHEITKHMGSRVSITYEEHPGIPLLLRYKQTVMGFGWALDDSGIAESTTRHVFPHPVARWVARRRPTKAARSADRSSSRAPAPGASRRARARSPRKC